MARVSCAAGTGSRPGGRGPWGPARGPWGLQLGPWAVGPGPGAGGHLVAQLVPVAIWSRSWCRWPCLCLYVARSRVCMSGLARTNTQGRVAWAWCRWPSGRAAGAGGHLVAQLVSVAVGRVAWWPVAGSRAVARGQGPPPTRGPKNGPGASCAGSSPFLHGQWCIKQFLRSSNKGPPLSTKSTRVKIFKNLKRNGLP